MPGGIDMTVVLAYTVGLVVLYLLCRLLLAPARLLLRVLSALGLGALAILLLNWLGGHFGFHLALNVLSASAVGFLGLPGILLLLGLRGLL
jgi:inhibitor of the pro-sigma K processing machinery